MRLPRTLSWLTTCFLATAAVGSTGWSATIPLIAVKATDANAAESARDPAVFTVVRTSEGLNQPLAVAYSISGTGTNGTDYERLTGSVMIAAGQTSATVVVRPADDSTAEPSETVVFKLLNGSRYRVVEPKTAQATIADNDTTVSVSAPDPAAAEAGRDPGVFSIVRSGPTTLPLTVNYTMSGTATNGTDYANLPGSVVIPVGQTSVSVSLTPIDDTLVDPAETATMSLVLTAGYNYGISRSATIQIADNDRQSVRPVLMVIANQDFYYREYSETRAPLVRAGIPVVVTAALRQNSYPHPGSGEGADGGVVMPNLELAAVNASDYSAIVFVGGWGASSYQYAFNGTYQNGAYNGSVATRAKVNQLVNDFLSQGKHVTAICHGVSVLAWARVNGVSPLQGRQVAGYHGAAPGCNYPAATTSEWHIQQNGAMMFASGALGNAGTVSDDVWVDGRIITAENYDTAARFGEVLAKQLMK